MKVWNLYQKAKTTHQLPSDLIDLPAFIRREYGYNVWFVCSQFDDAILYAGSHIESALYAPGKEGEPDVTINDILKGKLASDTPATQKATVTRISRKDSRVRPRPFVAKRNSA